MIFQKKEFHRNKFSTSIILCIDLQQRTFIMSPYWNTTAIMNLKQVIINHIAESIVNDFVIILFASSIYHWTRVTVFVPFTTTTVILVTQNKSDQDSWVPLPIIKIDKNVYWLVCLVVIVVVLFSAAYLSRASSTFWSPYTTKEYVQLYTWKLLSRDQHTQDLKFDISCVM